MNRKPLRKVMIVLAGAVLCAQGVRPAKNLGPAESGPGSLVELHRAPPDLRRMLETSCYDCHSNHTRYPWYAEVQPAGWFLAWHVRDGKKALNFSEFGKLGDAAQAKRLQYMAEAMQERAMPLGSYLWLHRDARLSDEQIRSFTAWSQSVQRRLRDPAASVAPATGTPGKD